MAKQTGKDNRTNEELIAEMMIANHNLESAVRKMHDLGRTKELDELFRLFIQHYNECKAEVLRRMTYGNKQ